MGDGTFEGETSPTSEGENWRRVCGGWGSASGGNFRAFSKRVYCGLQYIYSADHKVCINVVLGVKFAWKCASMRVLPTGFSRTAWVVVWSSRSYRCGI